MFELLGTFQCIKRSVELNLPGPELRGVWTMASVVIGEALF